MIKLLVYVVLLNWYEILSTLISYATKDDASVNYPGKTDNTLGNII